MTEEIVAEVPISEEFVPMELYALARFGRWSELLAAPAPRRTWRYATGAWHYGRGLAFAASGDPAAARAELAALRAIAAEPALSEMVFASGSTPAALLAIGAEVLEARIAGASGRWDQAIPPLREAVAMQDALPYTEPPPWYFPTREALGAALLEAGRPAEAEAVFEKQLAYTPRNGWSLRGLAASQRAQGKHAEADASAAQLTEIWARADVTPEAAIF